MIKVFISPHYDKPDKGDGGIRRVTKAMRKYLPDHGIEVVDSVEAADLVNCHAASYVDHVGKPLVASCHGLYWSEYTWPDFMYQVNLGVIEVMARAQAVTTPTHWVAHAIARGMLVSPEVVHHGVDPTEWERPPSGPQNYVLWNKARADIISNPNDLHEIAAKMPATRFVSTIGHRAQNIDVVGVMPYGQMKGIVRDSGVYLCTARETFGIGTIEAMAAGVPVAGWSFGGQVEIVKQGETGYLAPYGDYDALEECINKCLEDRQRLGENARKDVLDRWLWPDKIEQYANIFERVYHEWNRERPKVSVIVPAHNLAKYLDKALESVAQQTDPDLECLIIDDASTDSTAVISEKWVLKDDRFKYVPTPENLGLCGARNFGFNQSNGRYIVFLDADDMLYPDMIETLSHPLDSDPSIQISYGKLDLTNEKGTAHKPGQPLKQFNWFDQMAHNHQFPIGGSMMRRDVMSRSGGFRVRDWRAEDAAWVCRITSLGIRAQLVTDKPMLLYRVRGDSKSVKESRAYDDIDGDWTAWYGWRLGAETAATGRKSRAAGIIPPAHLVPFGAQTHPPEEVKHWSTSHHQEPLISVIIPVGPGHDKYLIDALDSLLAQTMSEWEAIVINDTGDQIDTSYAPWAKVINTAGSIGAGAARNMGIKAASGDLLLFLDADDWLLSNAMGAMLSAWLENKGTKYIYTNYIGVDHNNKVKVERLKEYNQNQWKGQHAVTILISKADCIAVGMFDESMGGWEDWDFPLKLAVSGYCGEHIPDQCFVYRKYAGSRREWAFDNRSALLEPMREKYSKYFEGVEPMARCCGGSRSNNAQSRAQSIMNKSAAVMTQIGGRSNGDKNSVTHIRVKFIGQERGAITYVRIGGQRLNKTYRGSANPSNRYANAHPDDVSLLESTGKWERVKRPITNPANVPQARPPAINADLSRPIPEPKTAPARPQPTEAAPEIEITDGAARLAKDHGLNIGAIKGSGKGGKITVRDVRRVINELELA